MRIFTSHATVISVVLIFAAIITGCESNNARKAEKVIDKVDREVGKPKVANVSYKTEGHIKIKEKSYVVLEPQFVGAPTPIVLDKPPAGAYIGSNTAKPIKPVKLVEVSKKANQVIDAEDWFKNNRLERDNSLSLGDPNAGVKRTLPEYLPESYENEPISYAVKMGNELIIYYGRFNTEKDYIVSLDQKSKKVNYIWDTNNYLEFDQSLPGSSWKSGVSIAAIEDGIHYLSYRSSVLIAMDSKTRKILWQTDKNISACEPVFIGDVIVTGYGMTNEPDFLHILNKYTGQIVDKISLKTAPDYIRLKGDLLYVRTYDTDYVFKITQ